jgi:dUTP pyrophosphatase
MITQTDHEKIMYLSIFIDTDDDTLKELYRAAAEKHNDKILSEPYFYDAGFDLFLPKEHTNFSGTLVGDSSIHVNKVDFKVKCCAKMFNKLQKDKFYYTPFYTYARSSISKTPLRLANNQGIIDAGYRGNLIGMFDCIFNDTCNEDRDYDFQMQKYSRVLQICAPGLVPICVKIVDSLEELGPRTTRGEGGIGSTGI